MGTDRPLSGIRVLDLTNVLAGPFACHQLAHLGAEVIKIEAVARGDLARGLGASPDLSAKGMGISFLAQNAGKQSITLNIKELAGKDILCDLVKTADVLVENFRPGVMTRLGVGAEVLRAENPSLIYCGISGFGQTGPWANRPAYDQIIQGAAGVMDVTGTIDGGPTRVGYPLADTIGGLTAAMAITAALNAPERGCIIDVAMLDAVLATMGWVVSNHLIGGSTPSRNGNENPTSAPSGAFQCADGLINIAANKDEQWEKLARHLGRTDLIDQSEFATREDRKANRLRLRAELETVLTTRPADAWEKELNAIGVPSGAVLPLPDVLSHPQITDRAFLANFKDVPGIDRDIDLARIGVMMDGARPSVDAPPPILGQNTDAILKSLRYTEAQIAELRKDGVI
ncbi:MAG: CoA transferase [Boseongicola sp.]|nr:CoA transferase [Boseongicola sp.]